MLNLGALALTGDRDHDASFTRVRVDCNGGYTYIAVSHDEWQSLVDLKTVLDARERTIDELSAALTESLKLRVSAARREGLNHDA